MRSRVAAPPLLALLVALVPRAAPAAPDAGGPDRTLTVAAAANMKPALEHLVEGFVAAHHGVEVRASYGASGTFAAQIRNGAPYDLFLSADAELPARLAADGLADGAPFTYALGTLVLWVPNGSPLDLGKAGLAALADPSVRKVAIANPALAPYGAAAVEALRSSGLEAAVRGKLVQGQSVAQAAQFALSGNAQAALLPLSLAQAPPLSGAGRHLVVPPASHRPIEQAGLVLAASREKALARSFARWLLGPPGREVLARSGYALPPR